MASAISSFASEWVGAVLAARALHLHQFSKVTPSQLRVQPSEPNLDPGCAGSTSTDLAPDGSPLGRSGHDKFLEQKQQFAVKIAHEELGEKAAIFLGCSVAARVRGLNSVWAGKALALLLLEAIADFAKAGAYAAIKIDVGRARFNFHWPSLVGVVLLGGASCAGLLAAIGVNCLIGEHIASAFG